MSKLAPVQFIFISRMALALTNSPDFVNCLLFVVIVRATLPRDFLYSLY